MSTVLKLPPLPVSLKSIGHHLKTATEHETRDPVVAYWCRICALQTGLKLDKSSKEALAVLLPLMDWLEKEKKVLSANEAITNEVVASAHLENHALKLFSWADKEDRAGRFNKNVVKSFYTCGMLFDALAVLGELTPENAHARKYAKWKAAYIHNCLKNGETPVPGPAANGGDEDGLEEHAPGSGGWQLPQVPSQQPALLPPTSQPPMHPAVHPSAVQHPVPTPRATVSTNPAPAPAAAAAAYPAEATTSCASNLTPDQVSKSKKYCKYAVSALDYDDKATAIDNLQKALQLLQTGKDT